MVQSKDFFTELLSETLPVKAKYEDCVEGIGLNTTVDEVYRFAGVVGFGLCRIGWKLR